MPARTPCPVFLITPPRQARRDRRALDMSALAANIEEGLEATTKHVQRPWLCFVLLTLSAVLCFAAGGPIAAALTSPSKLKWITPSKSAMGLPVPTDGEISTSLSVPLSLPATSSATIVKATSKLPPSPLKYPSSPSNISKANAASSRSVDAKGAVDPGGAPRVGESSPLIQGMIEAGFSRSQAARALEAVNATVITDVPAAITWALKQDVDKHRLEAQAERTVHVFDRMDFDGYALVWGDKHRTSTVDICGAKCKEWVPKPPSHFACNIFVFCPLPKCYAPAALPPGSMTGQCWLKHQEDPNNPQVNMKGAFQLGALSAV